MANRQIKDFTEDTAPSGSDFVLKQSSGGGIGSTKAVTIDNILGLVAAGDITQVNITAGTGLSGTQNTTSGAHTQTLALSHLGIQSLSDPSADRILFWDDSETAAGWLTVGSNLSLSGTTLTATNTDTTYSAGNGISLSSTTFAVAAGAGLAQESGGLALSHLGIQSLSDPDADRILFWDDSAGATAWLTVGSNLSVSGTTITATDTNTTYSAGNGIALGGTTFTVAAGTGLAQESGGLALSHLGIQSLSDPDADRILFWDDSAGASAWLTVGSNLSVSGTTITATDTNTTYSAGNGISLSTTTFSVAAGTGLAQESGGLALSHLGLQSLSDPDADRILFWDDSEGAFKWLTVGSNLSISGSTITASAGGSGDITRVNITAGTGLTGTTDTTTGDHTQTLALSHLGIQSLSDPDADRIMFWDDSAGAAAWLTAGSNLSISGTSISATDTNTTYSAGNGISLSSTTFSVSAGSGLAQESGGLALDDPINLDELTESTDATDDKIFLWDESASAWKYMTLDNLQDAIDTTGGGGGGSGDVVAGSTFTTAGVIMACDGDDKTIDAPNATLTTNGQGMTVSSAVATPFEVNSSTRDGNSTFKFVTCSGDSGSAQNNQSSIQIVAQTSANANLYLGDTDVATRGGLTYKNNGDSLQLKAAGAAVLELDSSKVVEFKIAGDSKTVNLQNNAMDDTMSGAATVTVNATEWLQIKVNGNTRYIPVWS